ncbi:MAG: hypothetical protein ABSF22_18700 [Bryobacteraceae bacterium]|jgi:hypothetical protein
MPAIRIRAASYEDADAIRLLNARNGMGSLDTKDWREGWETYPFASEFQDIPTGWVLETENGSVVGNLDNIHMLYEMHGRRIKGVIAAGWAVDAEHRGKSLQLMTTFFRQKGVDLWLNVSASPAAAQILTALKVARIPIPDYEKPSFWAVRPWAFARAALLRRSVSGAGLLAWPAGLALWARDVCLRSGRGSLTSQVRRIREFDERFDDFCEKLSSASGRLRAVRNRAVLEWRFRVAFRGGRAVIVVAERGAALLGYAILVGRQESDFGMNLYDVADMQAVEDDSTIIRDLLLGSIKLAREVGADAVKFATGEPGQYATASALRPYSYGMPFWQQYFKASSEISSELSRAEGWDFSRFDTF